MEWILASGSPRRQELLHYLTDAFTIHTEPTEETIPEDIAAAQASEYLACKKANAVAQRYPEALVIGADTTVLLDGVIYGKPEDAADAKRMLTALSGRTHQVVTGVCLQIGQQIRSFSCTTEVTFYPLQEAEIAAYIATGEPFDKAGAYAIQGSGALMIQGICGDYYNVMGLPIAELSRQIQAWMAETERTQIHE